jgi:hypothetical protein
MNLPNLDDDLLLLQHLRHWISSPDYEMPVIINEMLRAGNEGAA